MRNSMNEALEYIIDNKKIKTVFQPIISLKDGLVLGHEALSRITCESVISNPEMLFAVSGEYNRLWDLEQLCRYQAFSSAYKFMIPPYSKLLFINVNPNILHDANFKKGFTREFLKQFHIAPENIVFEITERNVILDMSAFLSTVNHYRSQDYNIAIDDAGAGYSGLNLISDIHPNYIKLDMKLIRNINEDKLKYALVKAMADLSNTCNINLIAEGIETKEELETLIKIGVHYGQGYYIQRPKEDIEEIHQELINQIESCNQDKITQLASDHCLCCIYDKLFKSNEMSLNRI
jgi:FOG: EAL domain